MLRALGRARSLIPTIAAGVLMTACGMSATPVDGAGGTPAETTIESPNSSDGLTDNAVVGCRAGPYFPASALESDHPPIDSRPEIEAAVRTFLDNGEGENWAQEDWRILYAGDSETVVVHFTPPDSLSFMTIELTDGSWRWLNSSSGGSCPLSLQVPEGLNTVEWRLDPAAGPLTAESTSIAILATELECASGEEMGERLRDPDVVLTETAVLIALTADPPPGDFQTCQGNPEQSVVVELPEPLGDRVVEDGFALGVNLEDVLG